MTQVALVDTRIILPPTLPPDPYQVVLSHDMDNEHFQHLQRKLRAYNRRVALQMEPPEAQALNIHVYNAAGEAIGGLAALTYWGWLVVKLLVIDEGFRGNGLGKRLLDMAHAEARTRGCNRAHTATYDFQALTFYRRHGYTIVGELADYPDGYHYYWLRKDFETDHDAHDDDTPALPDATLPGWSDRL